jgi:hypothetical protein
MIADPYASVLITVPPSNVRPLVKIAKHVSIPYQYK